VTCDQGDLAAAAALHREGLACWREAGTTEGLAGTLAEVATLAAVGGRAAEAARLFGALAAVRDPLGAAFELPTRAQVERAERAARAELGGAAFAAAVAAGRALSRDEAFAEATRVVEDIAAVAAGPTCGEADNLPPHARLTRREREVLGLLVEGRTDREIAAALCLSPRTVGHHVGHILAKLGVETRRGARAHALQQGFVPTAASGPG
jgi:non-specific serine/threonine protein kinase